jgi:hypothetical protein
MTDKGPETGVALTEKAAIRGWIKSSLEAWASTNDAFSFEPYHFLYRSKMEPEEVVFSVYSYLEKNDGTTGAKSVGALFRTALGELIAEPEITERKPILFGILLRTAAKIGCMEAVDALGVLSRQKKLQKVEIPDTMSDGVRTFDLLEMAATLVIEGKFSSSQTSKLCLSLIKGGGPSYEVLPELFERILEIEPNKAIHHATDLANEIQDFLLGRMEYGDVEFSQAEAQLKSVFAANVAERSLVQGQSSQLERLAKSASAFLVADLIGQHQAATAHTPAQKQLTSEHALAEALSAPMKQKKLRMTPSDVRAKLEAYHSETRTKKTLISERDDAKEAML